MSLLFLELSGYCVNAVRLHVSAADVLVRLGVDRDDFQITIDSRHDQLLSAGHPDHGPEGVEKRVAKPAGLTTK